MGEPKAAPSPGAEIAAYKTVLQEVLQARPSGMRQRLAEVLGKNRSFITQIANPVYETPIPARHVETILEICHFSSDERARFLAAYRAAHPARSAKLKPVPNTRTITLRVPDLGSADRNAQFTDTLQRFVRDITVAMDPHRGGPGNKKT